MNERRFERVGNRHQMRQRDESCAPDVSFQ